MSRQSAQCRVSITHGAGSEHGPQTHGGDPSRSTLVAIVVAGIVVATICEIAGRGAYDAYGAPYSVTGSLTLAAMLVWGGTSSYVIRRLTHVHWIVRTVICGFGLIAFSQTLSLFTYFYLPEGTESFFYSFLEDFSFVLGLALLFAGFYLSVFEVDSARRRTEAERQSLANEIEQRKRAQEALAANEETLRAIVASNQETLCLFDHGGTVIAINETAARRLGKSVDDLIGRNLWRFLPEEVGRSRRAYAEEAMRSGQPVRFEDARDGRSFDNYLYPILAPRTDSRCAVMAVDISERKQMADELFQLNSQLESRVKERTAELTRANEQLLAEINERNQAEEALRRSEAKYRELVENANSIILRMDIDGNITFFNEYAQQFFGYSEPDILGRNVLGTIIPQIDDNGHELDSMIRDISRHPDLYANNENVNIRRNGERVWIAWTNRPIHDADGHVREILCVGNDVTDRVHAERIIAEQRMKMVNAARMSALGEMAGGIAHEINNPLAIIHAGAEQLETLIENPSEHLEHLHKLAETILRNVDRVTAIIRALRNLSREGAKDPFRKTPVKTIVKDALELCQYRFRAHDIALDVKDGPSGVAIECRASQLSQVLLNLLNNAHDAVENVPEKWVKLDVQEEDECILFVVVDSGTEIPEPIRERMFIPFFSTKEEGSGVGLGLSLSRTIMEAHRGELAVDTNAPHTRFVARVPKRQS